MKSKKYESLLKYLSDSVNFHIIGHLFCPKFVLILQIFDKFLKISAVRVNFSNLGLFIKNLANSNKEYATVTISIKKLFIKWFNNTRKNKEK